MAATLFYFERLASVAINRVIGVEASFLLIRHIHPYLVITQVGIHEA